MNSSHRFRGEFLISQGEGGISMGLISYLQEGKLSFMLSLPSLRTRESMQHVLSTKVVEEGLQTEWTVTGKRENEEIFAFQGVDIAENSGKQTLIGQSRVLKSLMYRCLGSSFRSSCFSPSEGSSLEVSLKIEDFPESFFPTKTVKSEQSFQPVA